MTSGGPSSLYPFAACCIPGRKKGLFQKDLQSKFVAWYSLGTEAGKGDLTHTAQKAMVLYLMLFYQVVKNALF